MTIQCTLVDVTYKPLRHSLPPGSMYFAPWYLQPDVFLWAREELLTEHYIQDVMALRPPLMVVLPNGVHFCVDRRATNHFEGWWVTGEAPLITVSPSIMVGNYHGFLQNGVFTDDLDGTTYP